MIITWREILIIIAIIIAVIIVFTTVNVCLFKQSHCPYPISLLSFWSEKECPECPECPKIEEYEDPYLNNFDSYALRELTSGTTENGNVIIDEYSPIEKLIGYDGITTENINLIKSTNLSIKTINSLIKSNVTDTSPIKIIQNKAKNYIKNKLSTKPELLLLKANIKQNIKNNNKIDISNLVGTKFTLCEAYINNIPLNNSNDNVTALIKIDYKEYMIVSEDNNGFNDIKKIGAQIYPSDIDVLFRIIRVLITTNINLYEKNDKTEWNNVVSKFLNPLILYDDIITYNKNLDTTLISAINKAAEYYAGIGLTKDRKMKGPYVFLEDGSYGDNQYQYGDNQYGDIDLINIDDHIQCPVGYKLAYIKKYTQTNCKYYDIDFKCRLGTQLLQSGTLGCIPTTPAPTTPAPTTPAPTTPAPTTPAPTESLCCNLSTTEIVENGLMVRKNIKKNPAPTQCNNFPCNDAKRALNYDSECKYGPPQITGKPTCENLKGGTIRSKTTTKYVSNLLNTELSLCPRTKSSSSIINDNKNQCPK